MIKIKKQAHRQDKHKDATKQQVGKRENLIQKKYFYFCFKRGNIFGILNINSKELNNFGPRKRMPNCLIFVLQ